MALARTLILIPFRLTQISYFTLSLKLSDSDNCPNMGIGPLLYFPHPPRAGSVLLTLLFFPLVPSSYQVLCGSIYSFPLFRYSCLLSPGVLHALLCLKVYSYLYLWRKMYCTSTYSSATFFSNCCFLTCMQVSQEAGKMVWYSHLLKNFSQFVVIQRIKGFSVVNKAEVDVFPGILLFFLWPNGCWQFDLWFFYLF